MTSVRFIKNKNGDDDNSVTVELYKKEILEKRILNAESEYALQNPDADSVTVEVLGKLISYLISNPEINKKKNIGTGDIEGADSKETSTTNSNTDATSTSADLNESNTSQTSNSSTNVCTDTSTDISTDSSTDCMYFRGDVLEALADCTLILKRLPVLLAQYKMYSDGCNVYRTDRNICKSAEAISIPDFLIRFYFKLEGSEKSAIGMSEIRSSCRLLVALSAQRGIPRVVVLTSLVQAIRDNATEGVADRTRLSLIRRELEGKVDGKVEGKSDGKGDKVVTEEELSLPNSHTSSQSTAVPAAVSQSVSSSGKEAAVAVAGTAVVVTVGDTAVEIERAEQTNRRLRSLTRLVTMVTLVVRASGTSGIQDPSSSTVPQIPQQVSVDVVNHFINTDLPGLLTVALSSVPVSHPLAGEAINAILDPLEMITRPKLLANLDKLNAVTVAAQNKGAGVNTPGPGPLLSESNGIENTNELGGNNDSEGYQHLPEDREGGEEESASGMVTMNSGTSTLGGETGDGPNQTGMVVDDLSGTISNTDSTNRRHQVDSDGSDADLDLYPRESGQERVTILDLASANTNTVSS